MGANATGTGTLESDRDPTALGRYARVYIAVAEGPNGKDAELGKALEKELLARGVAVKSDVIRAEAVSRAEVRRLAAEVDRTEADSLLVVGVKHVRVDARGTAWIRYDFSFFSVDDDERIWRAQIEAAGAQRDESVIEDMAAQVVDRMDTDELLGRYDAAAPASP